MSLVNFCNGLSRWSTNGIVPRTYLPIYVGLGAKRQIYVHALHSWARPRWRFHVLRSILHLPILQTSFHVEVKVVNNLHVEGKCFLLSRLSTPFNMIVTFNSHEVSDLRTTVRMRRYNTPLNHGSGLDVFLLF